MEITHKPRIGITGPDAGGWPAWLMTKIAVLRAGGKPIRITPSRPHLIDEIDALVIGGGADVDPALSHEDVLPQIKRERKKSMSTTFDFVLLTMLWLLRRLFSTPWHQIGDKERDRLESRLLSEAVERDLPVLGICRGAQLINVFFGGSLHQEISEFYEETPQLRTVLPIKKVELQPGSRLHRILGHTMSRVNSLHHQAVKSLGEGLHITAREPNGIAQAIEHEGPRFIIGVQWHPEFLPLENRQQNLFRGLVEAARSRRATREDPSAADLRTASPTQ